MRLAQAREHPSLLQCVVADHVFARVKLDKEALQRLLRRSARALRLLLPQDHSLDHVHLVIGTSGAVEQIFQRLPHLFQTEAIGIERAFAEQIAAERAQRGRKILQFRRPVFRELAQS